MMGRILQAGDNLSINVELIDTQDNTQLWGGQYERELAEILDVKQEIAQEISAKLRLQLSGEEQAQLTKQGTTNPEAYQAYLRGQHHLVNRTGEGFDKAIESFNQAIEEDSTYAEAYVGLADTYYLQASYAHRTINEVYPLEMAAARKALEIDPTLAEAHAVMAQIMRHDWDWTGAEAEFKRALELNPNSFNSHRSYAVLLVVEGRFDEALVEINKALNLDPLSIGSNSFIGTIYLLKKEYDTAIEQLQKTLELDPRHNNTHWWLWLAYWGKGEREKALEYAEKFASLGGSLQLPVFFRHVLSGNRVEAARTIENWGAPLQPQRKAELYLMLGDKDRAIELLTNALDEGYASVMWANTWPYFDTLRDDPRFQDLLRRMNLEP